MNVLIRADASLHMGTGHIMRCTTLARALYREGANITFVCIEQAGNLIDWLNQQGFSVITLTQDTVCEEQTEWLPWGELIDVAKTKKTIIKHAPSTQYDWVVVDHYGLSAVWHDSLKSLTKHLLVIDDLADRIYSADLLLDQNLGRSELDYMNKTSARLLTGTRYALLRDEFKLAREHVRARRECKHILIALGGVDEHNFTCQILKIMADNLGDSVELITVVLGATAPHGTAVKEEAVQFKSTRVNVLQGVNNIAELMLSADLAIGAAGTTSWERCCLGLPTIVIELAPNQATAAKALVAQGVALRTDIKRLEHELPRHLLDLMDNPSKLKKMSAAAMNLVDGNGVERVMVEMKEFTKA